MTDFAIAICLAVYCYELRQRNAALENVISRRAEPNETDRAVLQRYLDETPHD